MGKLFYALYSVAVIGVMGHFSYSPASAQSGGWNANNYYHGSSFSGAGSFGGGSFAHK
jgi:hypothetical protein